MSALLQHLGNSELAWRVPADPCRYDKQHRSADGPRPAADAPLKDTPHAILPRWQNSHDVTWDRNQEFVALLAACRDSGGLARTHEVIGMFKRGDGGDTAQLARWIVARQVVSILWQDQTWFPWFQFDRASGRPQRVVGRVASELSSRLDDWQITHWFVQPHPLLDNATPAETLTSQPAVVLDAARASSGLARG